MTDEKESSISPVIAVVLILALVGVIAAMVSVSVLSNVDNILINNVKDVDVTIKISGDNMSVYMVSGKDLISLEDYTFYRLGSEVFAPLVYSKNAIGYLNASVYPGSFNDNISYINIVGDFTDGKQAVIFTGRIVDGYVVQTVENGPFKVTYNLSGGHNLSSGSDEVPVDNNEYGLGSVVHVADGSSFIRGSSIFSGWRINDPVYGMLVPVGGTFQITSDTILYADYTQSQNCNVLYYDRGTFNGNDIYNHGDVVYVRKNLNSYPIGGIYYIFNGWKHADTGEIYIKGTAKDNFIINSDVRLDAQWTIMPLPDTCHVTYDMNHESTLTAPIDTYTYHPNDPLRNIVTVKNFTGDINVPYNVDGKQQYFVSWNTQEDGSGNSYYYPDTFVISYDMTLYAIWSETDPYFRHGTNPDSTSDSNYWGESNPNMGDASYNTLEDLIKGINYWKPGTIEYTGSGNTISAKIKKDIPLAKEPITLKPDWKLTIIVNDTLSTTKIGNVYPSTNPAIWAAPIHNEIKSLFVLNSGSTLKLGTDLVLDGNYKMQESIIKVSQNSNLKVGNKNLTILNGIRVNSAVTTNGGGIYNEGTVTTDSGEIRIDNCRALNGGGFYNSNIPNAKANVKLNITNCRADYVENDEPKGAGGGIYSHFDFTLKSGSIIDNCSASENGGGIFVFDKGDFVIQDGSKIINNKAESSIVSKGNGGGIFSYYGNISITNSIISGNTASGSGGGVYIHYEQSQSDGGTLYLNYNGAGTLANSINGNNASKLGGGIYSNNADGNGNDRVYYNNVQVSALASGNNEYKWFSNRKVVNNAPDSPNYYPGREPVILYYTKGTTQNSPATLVSTVNEWANDYYDDTVNILKLGDDGNTIEVISDDEIVIDLYPITILYDLNIIGDKTLKIVSAPNYKGAYLNITGSDTELNTSANVTVDGNDCNGNTITGRTSALVNIDNLAVLNVDKNEFIVKNGDRNVSVIDNNPAEVSVYGVGINNTGRITLNDGGKLSVSNNKISAYAKGKKGSSSRDGGAATANAYGGGINNAGTIDVNDGGKLNVSNNMIHASAKGGKGGDGTWNGGDGGAATANAYGGGIYNTGTITVNDGSKLDVNNNEVTASPTGGNGGIDVRYGGDGGDATANAFGGGIYNNGTITVDDGTIYVNNNEVTASPTGGNGGEKTAGMLFGGHGGAATANAYGGGIYNEKITMNDGTIYVNNNEVTASPTGGKGGTPGSTGGFEYKNGNGGGIYNHASGIGINNYGTIYVNSNTATTFGGGIYLKSKIIGVGTITYDDYNKASKGKKYYNSDSDYLN